MRERMNLSGGNTRSDAPMWLQAKERGSEFWLRFMTRLSLLVGRSCSRLILYGIALYFSLFPGKAKRASRDFLQRGLGRPARWWDFYRHILVFSSTIHDRVFLLNQRFARFDVRAFGAELLYADHAAGKGILLLGAHLGSFEILRSLGSTSHFDISMAMYPENARRIHRALGAINSNAAPAIIELGTLDAMLLIRAKLDEGAYVGILADRTIGPGEHRQLPFLGTPAPFPIGPFRLASLMKRPVYFMTGVYCGSNRYEVHFEKLYDFAAPAAPTMLSSIEPSATIEPSAAGAPLTSARDAQINELMQKYVAALERNCRAHPFNWFNFYDFWNCENK